MGETVVRRNFTSLVFGKSNSVKTVVTKSKRLFSTEVWKSLVIFIFRALLVKLKLQKLLLRKRLLPVRRPLEKVLLDLRLIEL